MAQEKAKEALKELGAYVGSWFNWLIGWMKWATGIAIALALFTMVMEQYGMQVPYITVSNNLTAWAYIAGIYWATR